MIKKIIQNLKPSSTLLINEKSKQLEKVGKEVFKFGFGQSPFEIPEDIVNELKNNSHKNKYLPMQGLPELREAIASYYIKNKNYKCNKNNIIIGPGSKELMFLLHVLFDGDVILSAPSWVSYAPQAIIGRNNIHWIETKRENNWFPSGDQIEAIVSKNSKKNYLLFLNSPNNPSGQVCENFNDIFEITKKFNLIILSDEIYSELSFENKFKSISSICKDKTIISSGLSKWCGAGGWRLGFFIIPDSLSEIRDNLKILASETFSSVSAPIQYAAINAYTNDHSDFIFNSASILKNIGEFVHLNLNSNNVVINKPQGGFYLMPEFTNKNFNTSSEMCENILKETGVALLPGSDFGFSEKKMIARLSFTDFNGKKIMEEFRSNKLKKFDLIESFAPKIVEGTKRLKEWSDWAK